MRLNQYLILGFATFSVFAVTQSASAQNQNTAAQQQNPQVWYGYCQQRARQVTGYNGPVPDRYLPGGVLEGAAKGAARSQLGGLVFGRNKKQRKKAAKRDAIIGGIAGAIKRAKAKKAQEQKARHYRLELDACMRSGGY